MSLPPAPDRAAFEAARRRIAPHVLATNVLHLAGGVVPPGPASDPDRRLLTAPTIDDRLGGVWLKLECTQVTGSFKVRGALNRALSLPRERAARGLVTASGGNHGLAVAFAGHALGVPATVYLPQITPQPKADRIARWGARVVRAGAVWDDAHAAALDHAAREDLTYVHAFADPEVVAGQGTIALELLEALPDVDLLVVPIGGGGLIAGVASAARLLRPGLRVVGVEPTGAPTLRESLRQDRVVELAGIATTAATLAPRRSDPYVFAIIRAAVEEVVLVSDEEMRDAARFLLVNAGVGVELSGAASVAALLHQRIDLRGATRPCAIVSGAGSDAC